MSRINTPAVTTLKYDGARPYVTVVGIRTRLQRLHRMAEALMAEISLLEADLIRMEVSDITSITPPPCLAAEMRRIEAAMIHGALVESGWNGADAARRLGIKPTTLHYKLKQYGLCRRDIFERRVARVQRREGCRGGGSSR